MAALTHSPSREHTKDGTTYTFRIQVFDNSIKTEKITLKTSEKNIENLRKKLNKALSISGHRDYHIYFILENDPVERPLKTDKDLESLPSEARLRLKSTQRSNSGVDPREVKEAKKAIEEYNKRVKEADQKGKELRQKWVEPYDEGLIIYVSDDGREEWHYATQDKDGNKEGVLTLREGDINVENVAASVTYRWDGERCQPASDSTSFGAGKWDGERALWFHRFQDVLAVGASKSPSFGFREESSRWILWNEKAKKDVASFTWTDKDRHQALTSKEEGEWTTVGRIPLPVLLLLQLMRHCRFGLQSVTTSSEADSPTNRDSILQPFAKSGYATCKGDGRGWRRRYLVLLDEGPELYIYNSQEDFHKKAVPVTTIDLRRCTTSITQKKQLYCIVLTENSNNNNIITSHIRKQILVETRANRDSWVGGFISHGASKGAVKKEGSLKSRVRYWFVLQNDCLQYYLDRRDAAGGKPPKGEIDLNNCVVKEADISGSTGRKSKFGFILFQPNGRRYYIFASTLADLREWMTAIKEAVMALKPGPRPTRNTPSESSSEGESALDVKDNPFDEEDSLENIIFYDASEEEVRPGDPPLIKAATLPKLIERVTFDQYADTNYLEDFLLTFKTFTTPQVLLELLILRFSQPPPRKSASKTDAANFERKRHVVRLRVSNFFKRWVEAEWKDFAEDPVLYQKLLDFANTIMIKSMSAPTESLVNSMKRKMRGDVAPIEIVSKEMPPPILPLDRPGKAGKSAGTGITSEGLSLLDFDSEELARQIALIDSSFFRAIKTQDLFNKAWLRKDKHTVAPDLMAFTDHFNKFSRWIATEVVCMETLKERIAVVSKFIEIGNKCKNLNNLSAVMAIVAALQSQSVYRLNQTWAGISNQQRSIFEDLKKLISKENSFREHRTRIKQCKPPCVPFIGVYLTDLNFIEDGNPNFIENGLINFMKRRRLARIFRDIQQYQQTSYSFQEVPFIRDFIMNGPGISDDECYTLSCHREPRSNSGGGSTADSVKESEKAEEIAMSIKEGKHMRQPSMGRQSDSSSMSKSTSDEGIRSKERKELDSKFHLAVNRGDLEKVKSLLQQGVALKDFRESHGQTPLHLAAYEGHLQLVSYFLTLRDEKIGNPAVNDRDKGGWTALHCASCPGHLEICEILMNFGGDPTICNNDRNLPLHFLSRRYFENSRKSKRVSYDESPYHKIIKMMLDKGVDINFQNEKGDTALHQAAQAGNEEGVKILLKYRARVNIKNKNEETPYLLAEKAGYAKHALAGMLLEAEEKRVESRKEFQTHAVKLEDVYNIVKLMKDPETGVMLKDRKSLLITIRKCFVGEEAVDWMLGNLPVRTREEAVILGQKLLDSHFIQNTKSSRPFKDSKSHFYIFSPEGAEDTNYHQMKAKIASLREDVDVPKPSDFVLLSILGEGTMGKVALARKADTPKKLFAIKMMDRSLCQDSDYDSLVTEKKILQNDSPFLVHLHYCLHTPCYMLLVMDYIPGGDLRFHLQREERFSERMSQFVAAELVLSLEYLHSRGVVYRDLRPDNILIDKDGHICLTDFGLSKIISSDTTMLTTCIGNPAYMAPEILEGEPYTKSVEFWSLGVVLYQMLLGFTPFEFEDQDLGKLIRNILRSRILYPEELVSPTARSLLEAFLQKNPKQRLDEIDEIKHHSFFNGIDWKTLALKKTPSPFKIELKGADDVKYFDWKYTNQPINPEEFLSDGDANNNNRK